MGRSKQAQLLQCFCYDTVTELDKKQGRTHSEWAALPCGHIFHVVSFPPTEPSDEYGTPVLAC